MPAAFGAADSALAINQSAENFGRYHYASKMRAHLMCLFFNDVQYAMPIVHLKKFEDLYSFRSAWALRRWMVLQSRS